MYREIVFRSSGGLALQITMVNIYKPTTYFNTKKMAQAVNIWWLNARLFHVEFVVHEVALG
jgi:hypothetical protein